MLIAVGCYSRRRLPSIYAQSSFWTSSPTYFAIRVGVLMAALAALYFIGAGGRTRRRRVVAPLARFGRRSLFVYWIHVELVYGYATWPLHRRLPLWGVRLAYVAVRRADVLRRSSLAIDRWWRSRRLAHTLHQKVDGLIRVVSWPSAAEPNCTDLVIDLNGICPVTSWIYCEP